MFKKMDTDCTQFIERDEFTYVIRKVLGIPKKGAKNHAVSPSRVESAAVYMYR